MPEVAQRYRLCPACLRRQDGRPEDFDTARDDECFVCRGLMNDVDRITAEVVEQARHYEFETFAIGLSMPEGVQEREDEIRSSLKIKGKETIKLQLSAIISRGAASALRKKVRKDRPDLTLVADLAKREVRAFSRPLFFYGRYTKPRGIAQRRELCRECRGRGCEKCGGTGYTRSPSVEGLLRKRLSESGSSNMVFTWIGSEDRESEVSSPGRPFVVEVKNPVTRVLPKRFAVSSRSGRISVTGGRILASKPVKLPTFRFRTRIFAKTSTVVGPERLKELRRRFEDATVQFNRPYDRATLKRVSGVRARARGRALVIDAELDGGLPVKRFVSGELVSPSVSEVLKTEVECRKFDIRRVMETSELKLA